MSVIAIILVLLFVGFILWMVTMAPIPIHPWIKTLIVGLVAFALLIWILNTLGVHTGLNLHL